jgi:hypothetical protein
VLDGDPLDLSLARRALLSGLSEASADYDSAFDAAPAASLDLGGHHRGRDHNDGQVNRVGHILNPGIDAVAEYLFFAWIDGVDRTFVADALQVADDAMAQLLRLIRSPDHGHAIRPEEDGEV